MSINLRQYSRVILIALLIPLFICIMGTVSYASEIDSTDFNQLEQEVLELSNKYGVGEAYSEEDSAVLLKYFELQNAESSNAMSPDIMDSQAITPMNTSRNFSVSGSGYGNTASYSGSIYHRGTLRYTWGGNLYVRVNTGPVPRKITAYLRCTAYGIVGSGGIGKIYDSTLQHSTSNSRSLNASLSRQYSGTSAYYTLAYYADITTSSGSKFTVK